MRGSERSSCNANMSSWRVVQACVLMVLVTFGFGNSCSISRVFSLQLPETTNSGLHEIVLHIYAYDYNSCLAVIHRMISAGSFDILAEFMPGVKVLIQVAAQLGAYLERPR